MEEETQGELNTTIHCVIGNNGRKYHPIICIGCDRELLELYSTDESGEERAYRANCPYCGSVSFRRTVPGRYMVVPKPGIALLDIVDTDKHTEFKLGEQK